MVQKVCIFARVLFLCDTGKKKENTLSSKSAALHIYSIERKGKIYYLNVFMLFLGFTTTHIQTIKINISGSTRTTSGCLLLTQPSDQL